MTIVRAKSRPGRQHRESPVGGAPFPVTPPTGLFLMEDGGAHEILRAKKDPASRPGRVAYMGKGGSEFTREDELAARLRPLSDGTPVLSRGSGVRAPNSCGKSVRAAR